MSKKTISILGCGWLGIPLAEFLISKGHTVNGSTRSEEKSTLLKTKGIQSFLIDLENLPENISEFLNTDILIIATTCKSLEAHSTLISHLEKASISQIIFISSTSVYPLLNKTVTENDTTNDAILSQIEKEYINNGLLSTTIIRFAGLIGPKRNPARFFRNGKTVKHPYGFVNLIHLVDCINLIDLIIKKEIKNDVFNACADTHPKRYDFYSELAKRTGRNIPEFDTPETLQYKIVSNDKIKNAFNYKFTYFDVLKIPETAYD